MRAVRLHTTEDLRVEEIDEPAPGLGSGQAAQRLRRDLRLGPARLLDAPPAGDGHTASAHRRDPPAGPGPRVLRHRGRARLRSHRRVRGRTGSPSSPSTPAARAPRAGPGRVNACPRIGFHGLTSHGGGMAEYTVVPASMLHVLPESVDLRLGALVEPMAVAWRAVRAGGVRPGSRPWSPAPGRSASGCGSRCARTVSRPSSSPSPARSGGPRSPASARTRSSTPPTCPGPGSAELAPDGVDVAFDAAGVRRR